MKTTLLTLAAASVALCASAQTTLPGMPIFRVSPNGQLVASEENGTVIIQDLETGDSPYIYEATESGSSMYVIGNGNSMANGYLVGSTSSGSSVWHAGTWRRLSTLASDPGSLGNANGITADASRICGNAANATGITLDATAAMVVPCYWDLTGTTYGKQQLLPCPEKDYVGEAPQYVTALCISDDGKTIVGQIVAGSGFFRELVVYKQDSEGNWSYDMPSRELMNPNHVELPENPGDGPDIPSQENFMTEEELIEYDAAVELYYETIESNPDQQYPAYEDYMTDEEKAAYAEALKPVLEYQEKIIAYLNALWEIIDSSPNYEFNSLFLSPNGRYMAASDIKTYTPDGETLDGQTYNTYTTYLFDLETGERVAKPFQGGNLHVTGVSDQGDLLGYQSYRDMEFAYILLNGQTEWQPLATYLASQSESIAKWIESNWVHEVEDIIDEASGETEFNTYTITGIPTASSDFKTFGSYLYQFWNGDYKGNYVGYVVDLHSDSGIQQVVNPSNGETRYFDLQGREITAPSHGIFIRQDATGASKIKL